LRPAERVARRRARTQIRFPQSTSGKLEALVFRIATEEWRRILDLDSCLNRHTNKDFQFYIVSLNRIVTRYLFDERNYGSGTVTLRFRNKADVNER
jgi:hypothetical protein